MSFRRILGVLTVKDGRLVKSYGYSRWRPVGSLRTALINLDRWNADEIVVLDISRRPTVDPEVLQVLRTVAVSTPVAYGGGIRRLDDVLLVLDAGADRIVIEDLAFIAADEVGRIADHIGQQAILASLPIVGSKGPKLHVWRPQSRAGGAQLSVTEGVERLAGMPCDEIFVTDVDAEGVAGRFSMQLAEEVGEALAGVRPAIWFGGLDAAQAGDLVSQSLTAGIAFANCLSEGEIVLPRLRKEILRVARNPVRPTAHRHD